MRQAKPVIYWSLIALCVLVIVTLGFSYYGLLRGTDMPQLLLLTAVATVVLVSSVVLLANHYVSTGPGPGRAPFHETRSPISDDPQDLHDDDAFGRLPFANELANIFQSINIDHPSSVIALTGPWGSGKTSVLNTVIARLEAASGETKPWRVATFNPWRYASTNDLISGFFSELRQALPRSGQWSEARDKLSDLMRAIAPLGMVTTIWGLDSSRILDVVAKKLDGRGAASRAQIAAEEAMKAVDQRILFVIDDVIDSPQTNCFPCSSSSASSAASITCTICSFTTNARWQMCLLGRA